MPVTCQLNAFLPFQNGLSVQSVHCSFGNCGDLGQYHSSGGYFHSYFILASISASCKLGFPSQTRRDEHDWNAGGYSNRVLYHLTQLQSLQGARSFHVLKS